MSRTMKNSGIPWIGEVPKDWDIIRTKNVFSIGKDIIGDKSSQTQLLSLTTKGIKPVQMGNTSGKVPDSYDTYQVVHKENLVMCLFDLDCSAVFSGLSQYEGMISPAYKVLSLHKNFYPKFYDYWYSYIFDGRKYMYLSKNIRYSLTYDEFASLGIVAPPYDKQMAIARYLDQKCVEIDELISLQEKIIEELNAYKQSVITEAVCHGLNPDVPMKDSGLEWVGRIPEGWMVSRVGLHYSIILGKMLCDKPMEGGDLVPYFCAANVHFDGIGTEELKRMWFSKEEQDKYRVQVGDLLVVEGGAGAGGCAIVQNLSDNTFIQNSIMIVRSDSHDCRFLKYLLERLVKQEYIDFVCNKATIPHFTKDKLSQVPYAFPSGKEQKAIANYLDSKCSEIDALISLKQSKIDALKEYKKSIIYEYVTGKKSVNA